MRRPFSCFLLAAALVLIHAQAIRGQVIVPSADDDAPRELIFRELPGSGRLVGEVQIPERRLPLPDGTGETVSEPAISELAATEPPAEVNLAGRWLLTLPAGWQQRATIEKLEDGRYRLPGHGNLNGIYVLEGRTLTLVEHSDERKPHFVWEVLNDNTLRLRIDENASGANYLGATMGRQIDWDDFAENSRTTSRLIRPALVATPQLLTIRPAAPQQVTLTGQAFNDESQPPYIETEDDIIFMQGLEAWPEEVVSKIVTINGLLTNGQIEDGATTLPARFVQLQSYSVEGGPIIELGAESREP